MPDAALPHRYLLALGSNRPLGNGKGPRHIVATALRDCPALRCVAQAPVISTAPVGPSRRRYANSAAIVETPLSPPAMLALCQSLEASAGRRRARRWGDRTLDVDIILWSGGRWHDRRLAIPHPAFRARAFVLAPAAVIAPRWHDPVTGNAVRHLFARLSRPKPVDRGARPL